MNERDVRLILRGKGMCGYVSGPTHNRSACVLDVGHDGAVHDRGWVVTKNIDADPEAHDSRESIVTWHVSDGSRLFISYNYADAEWLASTLTRLDL